MSEKPEEPNAPEGEAEEAKGAQSAGSEPPQTLSSRPPVTAPPRPESSQPPGPSAPPRPLSGKPPIPSSPPRIPISDPPSKSGVPRPASDQPPPAPSAHAPSAPAPDPQSAVQQAAASVPAAPPAPAISSMTPRPAVSQPPQSIIDTERQTPVPALPAEAPAPPAPVPPERHVEEAEAHEAPGQEVALPAPSVASDDSPPQEGSPQPDGEDESVEVDVDFQAEDEGSIANPIRAMRVIRIEESKKRHASAPVLETAESTMADLGADFDEDQMAALAAAPIPEEAAPAPISEVEPEVDEEPVPESIEEVTDVDDVPPPPAQSTAPTPPRRDSQPDIPPADRKPPPPRRSARPSLPKAKHPRKKAWWETIFGDDFSRAYRPMSQAQLTREVDFILDQLQVPKGAVILDLACGQGEICVELSRRGYSVVGYDLSVYQLAMAGDNAQQAKQKINFLQGDMREMAFEEMFDAVICWDTSFGYFEDEKNMDVLSRVKKALKPNGRFLLDVMNRDFAAREAPYNHWFEGDGCVCMDDMSLDWITNRLRVKRSIILDDGRSKELQYSTRLYTLSEVGRMLHDVGFRVSAVSGDTYTRGAFFGPHSRRIIIQAGKP